MPITSEQIKTLTADLYEWSLKKIPEDTKHALQAAGGRERSEVGRKTLTIMLKSADAAERSGGLVCSDVGIPVYSIKVGTRVRFDGPVRQAHRRRLCAAGRAHRSADPEDGDQPAHARAQPPGQGHPDRQLRPRRRRRLHRHHLRAQGHGHRALGGAGWINRRTRARIYDDGHVERIE